MITTKKRQLIRLINEEIKASNESIVDEKVLQLINSSIESLEQAARMLESAGERYYDAGDNMRGNIRSDAGRKIEAEHLPRLKILASYLEPALNKETPAYLRSR